MTAARGRHAPPPEVRLPLQRERLLRAAAVEFAGHGYAGTSSESISRRAGMSKATFYEHFANKEECMLALFDRSVERCPGGDGPGRGRGAQRRARADQGRDAGVPERAVRAPRVRPDAAGGDHRRRSARRPAPRPHPPGVRRRDRRRECGRRAPRPDRPLRLAAGYVRGGRGHHRAGLASGAPRRARATCSTWRR